jgi:hypothetical protein
MSLVLVMSRAPSTRHSSGEVIPMKCWFRFLSLSLVAELSLLSGCAGTSTYTVLSKLPESGLEARTKLQVSVDPRGDATPEEAKILSDEIVKRLNGAAHFAKVSPGSSDLKAVETGTLLAKCEIIDTKRVSTGDRILFGGLAGQASVTVLVEVLEPTKGERIGQASATGRGSGGTAIAGTTTEALENAAQSVANFLLGRG